MLIIDYHLIIILCVLGTIFTIALICFIYIKLNRLDIRKKYIYKICFKSVFLEGSVDFSQVIKKLRI